MRAGANIEARDAHDRTALVLAATYDRVPVANVLVAMGANPNALDDRHDTPWLVTGVTGSVAMLEALLPANPDLTIRNRFGGLSPIPASERGHIDYVRRGVLTGVDLNHVNDSGWTALLEAVILGDCGPNPQEIRQNPPRDGAPPPGRAGVARAPPPAGEVWAASRGFRAAVAGEDGFEQRGPAEVFDMFEVPAGQPHPPHIVDVASLAGGDR